MPTTSSQLFLALPAAEPADPGLRGLRALVRLREDQVCARTAAANQLWAMLGNTGPAPEPVLLTGLGHRAGLRDRLSALPRRTTFNRIVLDAALW